MGVVSYHGEICEDASRSTRTEHCSGKRRPVWTASRQKTARSGLVKGWSVYPPYPMAVPLLLTLTDLTRSKSELVAENALLRQQLIILRRQVKRPACTKTDRMLLVLLARMVRTWKQALFIVQPETLLRWHRQGFRLFWKYKSRAMSATPKISAETVALIREMARDNRLWGAERIRGELLKLGLHVCKRTIQKYVRAVRTSRPRGQTWSTFLHTHAQQIWACDFLPVTDLLFRSLFAFFTTLLHSRRVIHVGITRSPTACTGYLEHPFENLAVSITLMFLFFPFLCELPGMA
jgi:hypothetical protein